MTKPIQSFQIGDRVAERPKSTIIPNLKAESKAKVAQYAVQRYGVVVDVFMKTTQTRANKQIQQRFLKILWDDRQTPSDHAQMRICHESDLEALREQYTAGIGG